MIPSVSGPQTETDPGVGAVGESWARPEAGARLGRHVLTQRLGEGAMGVVYAARDEALGREVALKLIAPRRTQSADAQQRFEQEARMLAAVQHPAVVEVYDVGRHAGRSYLVMPRLPGRTLRDWLRTPRLRAEILAMFETVGEGLAAAHRAGVLHCDFKPDNVLLDAGDRPKVADFGLARLELPETQADEGSAATAGGSGTPAYLAPEVHQGDAHSVASDIYAFHVALFEALTGARPFLERDLLKAKLRGIDQAAVSNLPWTLRNRLLDALDPNPRARPQTFGPLSVSRPRFGMWAVPLVAGLLVSAGVAGGAAPSLSQSCEERAEAVADDAAHWSRDPENAATAAMVERVHRELGGWRGEWRDAFTRACEAGDDAHVDCLAKVRIAGESWMRPPTQGDSELSRATLWSDRLASLPHLAACSGADESSDPALGADLAEVRFSLDRGYTREGVAQALALSDRAAARSDADTRFAAQILAADGLGDLREFDRAKEILRDVLAAAESTDRWEAATEACIQLIWIVGVGDTDLDEARVLAKRADAYAVRANGDVRLRVGALAMLSGALERRGELAEAAAVVEDALAIVRQHPEAPRLDHAQAVLVSRRVSLAARRNDLATVLDSADAIAALEEKEGAFSGSVLSSRAALAHAQGLTGQFDASIAGFDAVSGRYAQMGEGMAYWVHQLSVNAAAMEIRADRPERALPRLELACPAMALLRSETQTNVLLCNLAILRAQALTGAPVELEAALEITGVIEGRYEATRLPVEQAMLAVASIAVATGSPQAAELAAKELVLASLDVEMAWERAEAEPDMAASVAKYERVCARASPTLRPDLCLRALERLSERSLTIDVEARRRAFFGE